MSPEPVEGFPSACRLLKSREYNELRREGQALHTRHFIVNYRERDHGPSRLGITASRKVGGAVQRNRVKRLVREFFRRHRHLLDREVDLSVVAKRGAPRLDYHQVCSELAVLLERRNGS